MLIYFLKGKLPWQGLKANDKRTKYGLILETKQKTPISVLCEGLPKEFADFLVRCYAVVIHDVYIFLYIYINFSMYVYDYIFVVCLCISLLINNMIHD
jgi:hypothetical protein